MVLSATDPKDAEIIWTCIQVDEDMKKATGITDNQYINQFPFEACIVMKHHLAETIQKVKKPDSHWMQMLVLILFYMILLCLSVFSLKYLKFSPFKTIVLLIIIVYQK